MEGPHNIKIPILQQIFMYNLSRIQFFYFMWEKIKILSKTANNKEK